MRKIPYVFMLGTALLMVCLVATPQMALARPINKPPAPPETPVVPSPPVVPTQPAAPVVMWINHLDFLPGDPTVTTSFNAITSGVGGGLSGLTIGSTTTGEGDETTGIKVVEKGLQVPPGYLISGVRVCYESGNTIDLTITPISFISQIRLAQVQDPPATALVLLDDGTDLTAPGPVCIDSAAPSTPVDPTQGAVRLSFRVNFGTTDDIIVLRAVGLYLQVDPNGPIGALMKEIENHKHIYLTGKGTGHNNTQAETGPAILPSE